MGYCDTEHKHVDYMKKHCMKVCGFCQSPESQLEMEPPQDMMLSQEGLPEPEPLMEEPKGDEDTMALENPAGLSQEGLPEPEPPMEDEDLKASELPADLSQD